MGAALHDTEAFETVFTRTTAGHFLREFSFSSTLFTPPSQPSAVELADFVIQLDDLVMAFQLKEREAPSTDPETERTWFEKKVIKKATQQIRDTVKYLVKCPPEIANDRGRRIALPAALDPQEILKVVVFKGGEPLPVECARRRFHISTTTGYFIHVIAAEDWAGILETLVTPREIAEYLHERERICRAYPTEVRSVSEKALVGQFIAEAGGGVPSAELEASVDRLIDDTASFDILHFLNLFPDRITTDTPVGMVTPPDLRDAGSDYYAIVLEIAKLSRTELGAFKTRFAWAWERAGKTYNPPFVRFVTSRGIGFVFAAVPEGAEAHVQNGLANFVEAHKYEQRLRRCIGAAFVNEGESRLITWQLLDREWTQDPDMDRELQQRPLTPVREDFVPRYRLVDPL